MNYRHSGVAANYDGSVDGTGLIEGVRTVLSEERTNYPLTAFIDDLDEGFNVTVQCVPQVEPASIVHDLGAAVARWSMLWLGPVPRHCRL